MALHFAHPELLTLAILALLPLAIHLFNRQRSRPRPFAALDFLLRSKRKTARALRLRKILLFSARTCLLLALPLALARPHFDRTDNTVKPSGPTATAIALDTSLSMRAVQEDASRFEHAVKLALDALRSLPIDDPVTLVDCAVSAEPPQQPSFDREALMHRLQSMTATFEAEDLSDCLQRSARALAESTLPAKRILFATDLAQAGFRLDVPAPTVPLPDGTLVRPELILLDAANDAKALSNAAIDSLEVTPLLSLGKQSYRFEISVQNHSDRPLTDLPILLRIGNEVVAKGFLDVPARQKALQFLTHRFKQSGPVSGTVEIGEDALEADNHFHFTLDVPREVRALLVNGSPNPIRFLDETFFIQAALDAPGSPVRTTLREANALRVEELSAVDIVLLLNVREVSASLGSALGVFVREGGGLFISLGDQIDADLFNERLGQLLPRQLRLVKTAMPSNMREKERPAARLTTIDLSHPALDLFAGSEGESLLTASFSRYFLLESAQGSGGRTLASFDDGAPALIEQKLGDGRVLLFTSTIDRAWTDLPIRTGFLPLMQRLMGYLSRTLESTREESIRVGEVKPFPMPQAKDLKEIETPSGQRLKLDEAVDEGTPRRFAMTSEPGIYAVSGNVKNGESTHMPHFDFAVNVDPSESDLTRLGVAEFKAWFGEESVTRRTSEGGGDSGHEKWPLWSLLLACALLCFTAECLLLKR